MDYGRAPPLARLWMPYPVPLRVERIHDDAVDNLLIEGTADGLLIEGTDNLLLGA